MLKHETLVKLFIDAVGAAPRRIIQGPSDNGVWPRFDLPGDKPGEGNGSYLLDNDALLIFDWPERSGRRCYHFNLRARLWLEDSEDGDTAAATALGLTPELAAVRRASAPCRADDPHPYLAGKGLAWAAGQFRETTGAALRAALGDDFPGLRHFDDDERVLVVPYQSHDGLIKSVQFVTTTDKITLHGHSMDGCGWQASPPPGRDAMTDSDPVVARWALQGPDAVGWANDSLGAENLGGEALDTDQWVASGKYYRGGVAFDPMLWCRHLVCEGFATALALAWITGRPVWAAGPASNLPAVAGWPLRGMPLIFADAGRVGEKAARAAQAEAGGAVVRMAYDVPDGADWCDLLQEVREGAAVTGRDQDDDITEMFKSRVRAASRGIVPHAPNSNPPEQWAIQYNEDQAGLFMVSQQAALLVRGRVIGKLGPGLYRAVKPSSAQKKAVEEWLDALDEGEADEGAIRALWVKAHEALNKLYPRQCSPWACIGRGRVDNEQHFIIAVPTDVDVERVVAIPYGFTATDGCYYVDTTASKPERVHMFISDRLGLRLTSASSKTVNITPKGGPQVLTADHRSGWQWRVDEAVKPQIWHKGEIVMSTRSTGPVMGTDALPTGNEWPPKLPWSGSWAEWLGMAMKFADKPGPAVALTSALAGLVMPLAGAAKVPTPAGIMVALTGFTQTGKTGLLSLAASVWTSNEEGVYSSTTANAAMALLARHNHGLVCFDEFTTMRAHEVESIIYGTVNGVNRLRMNRDASLQAIDRWQTVTMVSSEIPISDVIREAGAEDREGVRGRVIELDATDYVLWGGRSDDAAAVVDWAESMTRPYGHLGHWFAWSVMRTPEKTLAAMLATATKAVTEEIDTVKFRSARVRNMWIMLFLTAQLGVEMARADDGTTTFEEVLPVALTGEETDLRNLDPLELFEKMRVGMTAALLLWAEQQKLSVEDHPGTPTTTDMADLAVMAKLNGADPDNPDDYERMPPACYTTTQVGLVEAAWANLTEMAGAVVGKLRHMQAGVGSFDDLPVLYTATPTIVLGNRPKFHGNAAASGARLGFVQVRIHLRRSGATVPVNVFAATMDDEGLIKAFPWLDETDLRRRGPSGCTWLVAMLTAPDKKAVVCGEPKRWKALVDADYGLISPWSPRTVSRLAGPFTDMDVLPLNFEASHRIVEAKKGLDAAPVRLATVVLPVM